MLGYLFSSTVTRRIKRLKESMLLAGSGKFGTRLTVRGEDELSVLAHSFNRMAGQAGRAEAWQAGGGGRAWPERKRGCPISSVSL
ncbi:HAMP domain-containing protein [Paenibacillus thiaminolyticus]|uniref:HAMP domain-containing protein n=1 Tax=Paenibacillus thiaminolyticus TaxID=49283 RepID=A0A3A3GR26_PANTH|nr:HAMP domain-containing protein [Paenibacillus thiaminolyticus]RJG25968.1 HAMP domain-containing protein [Paenibacillus thiaminolyticus]